MNQSYSIKITFVVKKIIVEKNNFYVMKVKEKSINKTVYYDHVVIPNAKEHFFVGDTLSGEGYVEKNSIGIDQIKLSSYQLLIPTVNKDLVEFLKRRIGRVQTKTLEKIVETYKEDTIQKCLDTKNLLVLGIQKKTAEKIQMSIEKDIFYEPVYLFIVSQGLPKTIVNPLYDKYLKDTITVIKNNPYLICRMGLLNFKECDDFALRIGIEPTAAIRIEEAILYEIKRQMKSFGHIYILENSLKDNLILFLSDISKKITITREQIEEGLKKLNQDNTIEIVAIETNGLIERKIYLKEFFYIENFIFENLYERHCHSIKFVEESVINQHISEYEQEEGFHLATNQKLAIHMALNENLSILTGGPGTGKTQTLRAIIYVINKIYSDSEIFLAAPTGKASKRMRELTGLIAKTIHRMLNLNPIKKNQIEEISPDYMIIDESSMIDAYLFYKLLKATSNDTKILLVGDYDQLPSVGAGNILFDLIESDKIPTTRLNEIFRQAQTSQIVTNAHLINKGNTHILTNQKDGDFFFIRKYKEDNILQAIFQSVDKFIHHYGYSIFDIQILTPTKESKLGVNYLNNLLQERYNQSEEKYHIEDNFFFKVGDKVMQTVNNYDLKVFNGETGIITSLEVYHNQVSCIVDFFDRSIIYNKTSIKELTLSYATTIHKSQGSEYPVIIIPIFKSVLLNRNIIYTGITRAKEKVVLIGDEEILNQAIENKEVIVRNSLLKEKIIEKFTE